MKAPQPITLKSIRTLLPQAQRRERIIAQGRLRRLEKSHRAAPDSGELASLHQLLLNSAARRRDWQAHPPSLLYDEQLPIVARRREIVEALKKHTVLIVAGETGSGKTTQLPKFCLEAGRGVDGLIGCTQPRRIAAMAVARRLAEELGEAPGVSVGYQIRFQENLSAQTRIKFMTDGILLAEAQQDRYLNRYDTLIVDEAHERSLNIDFVLGLIKQLLIRRRDLRLVITSATIDTAKFAAAFDDAPIIDVTGRMYPVRVRYLPPRLLAAQPQDEELTLPESVLLAVKQVRRESREGDVLVFMPTEQDIRDTQELLEAQNFTRTLILPLYARLASGEQTRIFDSSSLRKIIVATNIAETSLTIPGIKYVIDTGLARISQYLPRTRTTALPVTPISRSSADQRKGRCGRVADGVCFRLYSEDEYIDRPLYNRPEILRANLAEVILRMLVLKIGSVWEFPFVDRPDHKSIQDGFDLLTELGAITPEQPQAASKTAPGHKLTRRGHLMARLPVDPRLAAMLLSAHQRQCLPDMLIIAAALSIQDPRERPADKAKEADLRHAVFKDAWSDFSVLLNIWQRTREVRQTSGSSALKRFCREHFIAYRRLREWWDVHRQLSDVLEENDIRTTNQAPLPDKPEGRDPWGLRYRALHQSILSGFLASIAVQQDKNIYKAAKGREVMLFPGSTLFNRSGSWIVAAEMVETSRLFARTAANIDVTWLEEIGGDLCRRVYLDPHWDVAQDAVLADEQISLFGLIIVPRRKMHYRRVDAAAASDIFIRSALVQGLWKHDPPFMQHNRAIIDEVLDMENRLRRRDLLVGEDTLFAFYRERLDHHITDTRALQHLIRRRGSDTFLRMQTSDAMTYDPDTQELELYPQQLTLGEVAFTCNYHFEPGETRDGVTLCVPAARTSAVPRAAVDWVVPGLYREKLTFLLKGLPKTLRKRLVPLADTIAVIEQEMPRQTAPLATSLSLFILKRFGVDIPAATWQQMALPDHLKMRLAITDHQGRELHSSRDPSVLDQATTLTLPPELLAAARRQWKKNDRRDWDFGELPTAIPLTDDQQQIWEVYPALVPDEQEARQVHLRLLEDPRAARRMHPGGVARLYEIVLSRELKFLKQAIKLPDAVDSASRFFGGRAELTKSIYQSIITHNFARDIRSRDAFEAHAARIKPDLHPLAQSLCAACVPVIQACENTRQVWRDLLQQQPANAPLEKLIRALQQELTRLVPPHFMELYALARLHELPRYIRALALRAQRAALEPEKEHTRQRLLAPYTEALNNLLQTLSNGVSVPRKQAIEDYFWMIEEYKISLFAQELKTAIPISAKRLNKKLDELARMV